MTCFRSPWALPLALAGVMVACTDPRFREDTEAGPESDTGTDGGLTGSCVGAECTTRGPADGGPSLTEDAGDAGDLSDGGDTVDSGPSGALPEGLMLGRFAARIYSFTTDGFAAARGVGYSYMDIRRRGSDVVLSDHYCSFSGGWALFLEVKASFEYPAGLPPREITVHEGSDGWYTTDTPYAVGYTFDVPDVCNTPGKVVPATAGHWNQGTTCTCPTHSDEPPTSPSDCRVTDPDGDGKPGLSVGVDISGAPSEFRVVQKNQDRYLRGQKISDDRMVARFASHAKGIALECVPAEPCTLGNPMSCAAENNLAELVKIDDDWTCDDLLEKIDKLFPIPPPQQAQSCGQ